MSKQEIAEHKTIALNRKAQHDYYLEERFEAGLILEGWEVKSLRAGKAQLKESYVIIKNGAAWLLGAHLAPLPSAARHTDPDPTRTRKCLLHHREITKLIGLVERKGYTLVPVALYWKHNRAKLEFAVAKGKKLHDVRAVTKEKEWQREKARVMRRNR
jgi:SsrA-binding protein